MEVDASSRGQEGGRGELEADVPGHDEKADKSEEDAPT